MKVIDFSKYKEKKDHEKQCQEKYKELRDPQLDDVEQFDITLLELIDLFMQEHYPDYHWKFEIFLNELDEDSKED